MLSPFGKVSAFGLSLLALTCVIGCGKNDSRRPLSCDEALTLAYGDLPAEAVLVKVGARSISKGELEDQLSMMVDLRKLGDPKFSDEDAEKMKKTMRRQVFIYNMRNLFYLAGASEVGVKPTEKEVATAQKAVLSLVGNKKFDFEKLMASVSPEAVRAINRMIENDSTIQAYFTKEQGDQVFTASEEDLKLVKARKQKIAEMTEAETKKAWALAQEIVARLDKNEDFDELAEKYSITHDDDQANGGYWFATAPNLILDEKLRNAVIKTAVGNHTQPMETNEGLYIVKVVSREGMGEPSVVNQHPEKLKLKRIIVRLPFPAEKYERNAAKIEVERYRTQKFRSDLFKKISKDLKIDYPCGSNVLERVSRH